MAPHAPAPAAVNRRRAERVRRHGGTATPMATAGHPDGQDTGGTGPRYDEPVPRPDGPAPPPHRPPPIAQPRTRGGPLRDPRRTGADGRGGIGGDTTPDRAQHGPGVNRPPPPTPTPFSVCPADWDKRCGWFPHNRLSSIRGGRARKQGGLYLPQIADGLLRAIRYATRSASTGRGGRS